MRPFLRNVTIAAALGTVLLCIVGSMMTQGRSGAPVVEEAPTVTPTARPAPTPQPLPTATPAGYVSRATMGDAWPLTVEEGMMQCLRPQQVYFLSLDQQRVWAVNVPARSQIEEKGWSDILEITAPGADLFPLIDIGLDLCP